MAAIENENSLSPSILLHLHDHFLTLNHHPLLPGPLKLAVNSSLQGPSRSSSMKSLPCSPSDFFQNRNLIMWFLPHASLTCTLRYLKTLQRLLVALRQKVQYPLCGLWGLMRTPLPTTPASSWPCSHHSLCCSLTDLLFLLLSVMLPPITGPQRCSALCLEPSLLLPLPRGCSFSLSLSI